MKFAYVLPIVIALSACSTTKIVQNDETSPGKASNAIRAFEDVCLKTAPSFSGAPKAASSFGITEIIDAGFMKMGFNKDHSLSVQIKPNKECVITTPSQHDDTLTNQFLQVISQYSGETPDNHVPTEADINGIPFMFQHDRKGGEAYVMLKVKG